MKLSKFTETFLYKNPIFSIFALSMSIGVICGFVSGVEIFLNIPQATSSDLVESFFPVMIFASILISPMIITLYNIGYLVVPRQSEITKKRGRAVEYFTIVYGAVCTFLYVMMNGMLGNAIVWDSHWSDQLYNEQVHSPILIDSVPTLMVIGIIAAVGYILLRVTKGKRLPPIPTVFCISALYLGLLLCVLWIIQLIPLEIVLCVYPFNFMLIFIKLIREQAEAWRDEERNIPEGKNPLVTAVYTFTANSANLPWLGFLAAIPLLGMCIAFLALFGQTPDSIIRAWTETADWTLSNQTGPQNIIYDEHYLCTVAAGGHKKVVRPIRMGRRHGHEVIVNRQLCVANAFEGLLQERLPRFHKWVRRIYDKYGYPVARHIRSPYAADAVWVIMKPLEWVFVFVLYLFDIKPENRIAVQYPHTIPPKI